VTARIGSSVPRFRPRDETLAGPAPWSRQDIGPLGLRRWIAIGVRDGGEAWYVCRVCGTDSHERERYCGPKKPDDWRQDGLPACHLVTASELRARGAL